ncbi:chromosome partition protein Smc [Desulfosporosinus acididurans]|uniref:Nuclease SbcCD subunit C n=1 Tax=Desulfosporosinus acididurans TaxID=476652 RepID=A0A0J1FKZ6_9FIRM|nr:AAA family ATPase [Desulfosporosinus acididurans]KLU64047.1 chromosome partition protein Smc [Desulfosporosinus acididurans]
MNQILLSKMEIRNFKGIKDFNLDIGGLNASIFGENGKGKTTLYDAFLWALFNKDSANRADFSVKPQDKEGNDIHFLETDVTLHLLINGQSKTLRKMLKEKWTRKRGTATDEFTGHETSYWVDDVPAKAKEYQSEINVIFNENGFKILTNPFFFCTQIKWEDRRKILMEICGDVSDADVIASDKSLEALTEILSGKSINDQRKIIAEKIKMLNEQIEAIPIKINELSRTVLGEEINYSVVEAGLLEHKASLRKIEKSMLDAGQLASDFRQKQQEAFKFSAALEDRKKELDTSARAGIKQLLDEKTLLENEKYRLENSKLSLGEKIKSCSLEVTKLSDFMTDLRTNWGVINSTTFNAPDPDNFICPTCKRTLPEHDIEHQIKEMKESFDQNKQSELAKINADGKSLKERKEKLETDAVKFNEELFRCEAKIREIEERLAELSKEIDAEPKNIAVPNYNSDEQYRSLQSQYNVLMEELNKPVEDTTSELLQQKAKVTEQIETLNNLLHTRDVAIKTKARIEELKAEERTLAQQLSEFEKQRYLIEQFIKAKVNLLEGNINSRFKIVKWKLFKTNINGGIEEICEPMVNGVGFSTNLNHAARVNAGLDIINVLADHYGCTAPIWIDFRESVSKIIDTKSQVINLIKSEPDKVLRVEVA